MWQIFMLTTLLALAGCKNGGGEYSQSVSEYATMQVAPVNKTLSTQYPAAIQGKQDIAIFPQVTGTITRLCVNEGQAVKRGQVLFIIDQVPYQAALATARANMEAADATLATAQLTYDSKKEHNLIVNAIDAVKASIEQDFTPDELDNDNDGYIDNVCFVIQGNSDGWQKPDAHKPRRRS